MSADGSLSRRGLLGRLGAAGAAGAVVAGGGLLRPEQASAVTGASGSESTSGDQPFRGVHQSGIITPAQDRLVFAALDVLAVTPAHLRSMLAAWTTAAEAMTQGLPVPDPTPGEPTAAPDTGEVLGEPAGGLTITIGYGPSLFAKLGLGPRAPSLLASLPTLSPEHLDPAVSGGDIAIQACAEDPQVAFHAVRNLARLGTGVVDIRWFQTGFGRTSTTTAAQTTPRNLMGFKDGTRNLTADDTADLATYVWADPTAAPDWMVGGSYLVARKIRMFLEDWDSDEVDEQDDVFGRFKASGAPLTGTVENDPPDFGAVTATGAPVIPAHAHIRLAAFENNSGLRILRRGYSYTDGVDPTTHLLASGLFFLAYMRDPAQFVQLQTKLGAGDALNEYIDHVSSAVFACPGGLAAGADWGSQLFG
jgi:deferrochelatase/peroxidase EfeB